LCRRFARPETPAASRSQKSGAGRARRYNHAMCHYVTATMSAGGDEATVRRIAKGFLLRWEQIENSSVRRVLVPGEKYFFTTRGMCDCGTDLGSALRTVVGLRPPDHEREAKKLRKKGWGAAKIERHLKDRQSDYDRRAAKAEERNDQPY